MSGNILDPNINSVSLQAVVLPIFSSIAGVLCVPPLALHWKNRNFPAVSFVGWFLLLNLLNFANALIWPTDASLSNWDGTGLCDVEVKLQVASYVGLPGALACIFRSLAVILDTDRALLIPDSGQRIRKAIFETTFCAIIPIISMVMQFIVQPNRYYLFTVAGCVSSYASSWPTLVLCQLWPLFICLVAVTYCVVVLVRIIRYSSEFDILLASSGSNMNKFRFLKLFSLSSILLLVVLPLQIYVLYFNISTNLPWLPFSWDAIHGSQWNTITPVATGGTVVFPDHWVTIVASCVLFLFYGLGNDAIKLYRSWLLRVGVGRLFPSLYAPYEGSSYTKGLLSSISTKAKSFYSKTRTTLSRTLQSTYNDDKSPTLMSSHRRDALTAPQVKASEGGNPVSPFRDDRTTESSKSQSEPPSPTTTFKFPLNRSAEVPVPMNNCDSEYRNLGSILPKTTYKG